MPSFTVDTKLFQELGELLVAKESTALVELIKNSYDADATVVTVFGSNLRDAKNGKLVVQDDGLGMTADEFENGFLRIAGRTKITADRRSTVFGRRYTGEKGVGRLAAHKLAREVRINSRKAGVAGRGTVELPPATMAIRASIDWDAIEALETVVERGAQQFPCACRLIRAGGRKHLHPRFQQSRIRHRCAVFLAFQHQTISARTAAKLRRRGAVTSQAERPAIAYHPGLDVEDANIPFPQVECVADIDELLLSMQLKLA